MRIQHEPVPDSTAVVGNKVWIKNLVGTNIMWLYSLMNSSNMLHRIMIF